jgi:hypothetical protein
MGRRLSRNGGHRGKVPRDWSTLTTALCGVRSTEYSWQLTTAEFGSPETGLNGELNWAPRSCSGTAQLLFRPAQAKAATAQVHAQQWKLLKATFGKRIELFISYEYDCLRLVLVLLTVYRSPSPRRCPFFSLGPAAPAPSQYSTKH